MEYSWMTDGPFWSQVDRSAGPDKCWPWTGFREDAGYGRITRRKRRILTHRYAWAQLNGMIIPDTGGLQVRHRCDNPPCCNPLACLLLGTATENMADCVERGRRRGGRRNGEVHPRSKLTDAQVNEMRADRWERGAKVLDLATKYGVSKAQVSKITCGVSRGQVTDRSSVVLTAADIDDIRTRRERGEPLSAISAVHDVSMTHISHVINRRGYS